MMVVRTVAIDEAVRQKSAPQLVILGAGLDGRAWRMPELRDAVVFEVDHPDSQRDKRARVAGLAQAAREVRFVSVDFTRDDLDQALGAAGHDPARPTTWIWEGVVMYLERAAIEKTLAVIERRSAAGSRLIIAYHSPALILALVGVVVGRLGEPLRSVFTADAMSELLQKYRFTVTRDEDLPTISRAFPVDIIQAARRMKHARIVTADRLA
jgi:methyltransferase (TIGR00027 family)